MQTSTPAFIPTAPKPVAQPAPVQSPTQPITPQSNQTIIAKDGTVLDAGIVNLSKAIKQQESAGNYTAIGDNGTSHGAYQWNKDNFAKGAQQFGLDPNDFSPVNQDKVAYAQIKAYKDMGYSPEQIASVWNSGKKDPTGNQGTVMINGKPVSYDTPKYVSNVMNYFQQNKAQQQSTLDQSQTSPTGNGTPQEQSPSVGGFLGNVVSSGANFLGNTANALLHPIQTVQNIGGAGVGALQELGGQQNDNTAKFDDLKNYFVQRYGSVDNLLHTAYTDPVGLAGDVSAALGIGGGIAGVASKGAELAGLGEAASAGTAGLAGEGFTSDIGATAAKEATGLTGALKGTAKGLGTASELTNPLTPVVKGAGALLNQTKNISDVVANPQDYSFQEIANSSRASIAQQIESALEEKQSALDESGSAYKPFRNSAQFTEVTPDALASLIEKNSGATVDENGVVQGLNNSKTTAALQNLYDTWKQPFASGELTASEFHDFRQAVGSKLAKFENGLTSNPDLQKIGRSVYDDVNKLYRKNFPGLEDMDTNFSDQKSEFDKLKKGFIDKDGNLLESATNKIANSLGKGKDAQLERLEQIVPGITRKLQVMKTIEDLNKGSFTSSIVEKGGIVGGLLSGNIKGAALALTSIILSKPEIAVPLMRALGSNIELVKAVMANLAKSTTLGVVANSPQQTSQQSTTELPNTGQNQSQSGSLQTGSQPDHRDDSSSPNNTTPNFDVQGALQAGYTQQEIDQYLASKQ